MGVRCAPRGIKVGVLSNTIWPRAWHEGFFERDGVLDLIDGDVYTSEIPWTKPSPRAFRAAMDAVGATDPARCVYVGDRLFDDIWGAHERRPARDPHPAQRHPGRTGRPHRGRRRTPSSHRLSRHPGPRPRLGLIHGLTSAVRSSCMHRSGLPSQSSTVDVVAVRVEVQRPPRRLGGPEREGPPFMRITLAARPPSRGRIGSCATDPDPQPAGATAPTRRSPRRLPAPARIEHRGPRRGRRRRAAAAAAADHRDDLRRASSGRSRRRTAASSSEDAAPGEAAARSPRSSRSTCT